MPNKKQDIVIMLTAEEATDAKNAITTMIDFPVMPAQTRDNLRHIVDMINTAEKGNGTLCGAIKPYKKR